MKQQSKLLNYCEKYLYPLVLLILPLRHVFIGVDFWDTGYNYANFRFFGTEHMDSMWLFSTYIANLVGHFFTLLPGGKTLIGLNIYTGLVLSLIVLIAFYFLTRELKFNKTLAFLGEVLAICLCSCPTALLYNYLTYLFLMLCVICLYKGLLYDKKRFLYLAGICLGLNVFVRFPDIAEVSMIVGVWAYAIICRKKIKAVLVETGVCIAGFCTSAGGMLLYMSVRYGFWEYVEGIKRLFAMTESAPGYKPKSMIFFSLQSYIDMFYWVFRLGFFVACAYILYWLIPKKWDKARKGAALTVIACAIFWIIKRELAIHDFYEYVSVFRPAVLILILAITICLIQVFRKKSTKDEKLIAGLIFLVIIITPIGSNTGLYAILSNLCLVMPYVLCMIKKFVQFQWEKQLLKGHFLDGFPIQAFLIAFLLYFSYYAIGFGATFVFGEAKGLRDTNTFLGNNEVLEGVLMDKSRAAYIGLGTEYIKSKGLGDRELITYGYVPALHFYLDMAPAFNAWSDLLSFQPSVMKEKMEELEERMTYEKRPVIILERKYALYLSGGAKALLEDGYSEEDVEKVETDEKFKMIVDFMDKYSYELGSQNWKYSIYEG